MIVLPNSLFFGFIGKNTFFIDNFFIGKNTFFIGKYMTLISLIRIISFRQVPQVITPQD